MSLTHVEHRARQLAQGLKQAGLRLTPQRLAICRALAERLGDGKFVCPLGGEYQLLAPERDLETWASSALPPENRFLLREVPEDFQLPLLNWFRGLRGDLRLDNDSLGVHLEIDMTSAAVPK